ncbi:MAG TPA: NAD(P)(+) transhydrogenase (Re/Si-specific) subunit alpha, partial [Beijerinckiaceae bacterium]|nr:NAD(P)(+) transhydrogenase (Re/Si-specific) subunit alpha [Beijerinckiaceae bacterium]
GGNCELSKPGVTLTTDNGVKVVGYLNVPGRLAATSSSLYARNLYAFVETLVDKSTKSVAIKWDDELVKATCLTRDGAIVHPNFQPKPAAVPNAVAAAPAAAGDLPSGTMPEPPAANQR